MLCRDGMYYFVRHVPVDIFPQGVHFPGAVKKQVKGRNKRKNNRNVSFRFTRGFHPKKSGVYNYAPGGFYIAASVFLYARTTIFSYGIPDKNVIIPKKHFSTILEKLTFSRAMGNSKQVDKEVMTKSLNIAVAGTGYFSQFHLEAWSRLAVNVKGVCSLDADEARRVAIGFPDCESFTNFETMLDTLQPELVDIVVPPSEHFAFLETAIDRGIDIICQKPFTNSLVEATKIVERAESQKVRLVVHENFRFQPWHIQIKKMIDAGQIGEPYQVAVRMRPGDGQGPEAYLNRQPYFQNMKRFLIHDVFRYYFGEIKNVMADLKQLNPKIHGEDAGIIIFNFKNGVRGLFDGNRLSDHIALDRRRTIGDLLVEGSKGSIRLNGDGDIFFRHFGENAELKIDYEWNNIGFAGDSVYSCQKYILDAILSQGPIVNTGADYLQNLKIEESIYKSNQTGARISVL